MAINPMAFLKLKGRLDLFHQDHPRVRSFIETIGKDAIQEGSVLELKVTSPDGKEYVTNIKLNANDIQSIQMLRELKH